MSTFSYTIDWKNALQRTPRTLVAQFGDGYSQRQADGLNANPKAFQLKFENRSNTEADNIEDFLTARGGWEAFDWTDPDGDSGKYICKQWERVREQYNLNTITAVFQQVYE